MNPFKKSALLLFMLVAFLTDAPLFAQPVLGLASWQESERAKEIIQDNEYVVNDKAVDNFFYNPILLNGKALDYNTFSLQSQGVLTLIKGVGNTTKIVRIPFHVYLRRNGTILKLHGDDASKPKYLELEILTILKYAKPGDVLIIEPANEEDWQAKRILKLIDGGC